MNEGLVVWWSSAGGLVRFPGGESGSASEGREKKGQAVR